MGDLGERKSPLPAWMLEEAEPRGVELSKTPEVYADWLTERGDPRGELIQVRVELGRTKDAARRKTLEARHAQLMAEHREKWIGPITRAVTAEVVDLFRAVHGGEETDAEILEIDPNDFDSDPSMFYEALGERFGVEEDPDNDYFGGFGGPVSSTIEFIASRWDGVTLGRRR